jgi:hypothetical protein
MIARTSRIAFCAWLFLAGTLSAVAQTYTITEIGVLKGNNESSGFWLNSAGEVVGCSYTGIPNDYPCTGTAGQHAFLWSKSAGLKDLGTMSGGTISGATGINDSGEIVGYSNVKGSSASDFCLSLDLERRHDKPGNAVWRALELRIRNQLRRRNRR